MKTNGLTAVPFQVGPIVEVVVVDPDVLGRAMYIHIRALGCPGTKVAVVYSPE